MPKKPKHETTIRSTAAEYLTFVSTVGEQKNSVELRYEDENIWLTQRLMAELYGVNVRTINIISRGFWKTMSWMRIQLSENIG